MAHAQDVIELRYEALEKQLEEDELIKEMPGRLTFAGTMPVAYDEALICADLVIREVTEPTSPELNSADMNFLSQIKKVKTNQKA